MTTLEKVVVQRNRIRALGAEEFDPARSDECWRKAMARAEDDVAAFLDAGFRKFAAGALAGSDNDLAAVLGRLAEPLAILDELGKRLAAVGAPAKVKPRVVGPRIVPLVHAAFERVSAPDRQKIVAQSRNEARVWCLHRHDLDFTFLLPPGPASQGWRACASRANKPEVLVLPDVLDRSHYRKLRQLGHRVPCAYTLLETALCVARAGAVDGGTNPDAAVAAVREVARDLPADLLKALAEMDVARLSAMVTFLERWFDVQKRDAQGRTWSGSYRPSSTR